MMMTSYVIKAASRHILLAELVLGSMLLAYGACIAVDQGSLERLLRLGRMNVEWIVPVVGGLVQSALAVREWFWGRGWSRMGLDKSIPLMQQSVGWRGGIAFVNCFVWLYAFKEFILNPVLYSAIILLIVAPVAIGINWYSVVQNRKVWTAINPKIPTSTLRIDGDG